jgi:hypothetical protein
MYFFLESRMPRTWILRQAIFNAPVGADLVEQLARGDFFPCQARKTIPDLFLDFPGLEGNTATLQFEDLLQIWPIQKILELAADSDGSRFKSPMPIVGLFGCLEIFRGGKFIPGMG